MMTSKGGEKREREDILYLLYFSFFSVNDEEKKEDEGEDEEETRVDDPGKMDTFILILLNTADVNYQESGWFCLTLSCYSSYTF